MTEFDNYRALLKAGWKQAVSRLGRMSIDDWFRPAHLTGYAAVCIGALAIGIYLDNVNNQRFHAEQQLHLLEQGATVRAKLESQVISKMIMARGLTAAITTAPVLTEKRYSQIAQYLRRENSDILNIAMAPDMVVKYVYPEERNAAALGLDYRTSEHADFFEQVRLLRNPGVLGPVKILQGEDAMIIYSPVYIFDDSIGQDTFWGLTAIVVESEPFFLNSGIVQLAESYDIALRAIGEDKQSVRPMYGDQTIFAGNPEVVELNLPIGKWQLAILPKGGWAAYGEFRPDLWLTLAAVALLLIAALAIVNRHRIQRSQLEQRLTDAIEVIPDGFAMFDKDDRLVMCNSGYREMYCKAADLFVPGTLLSDILGIGAYRGQFPAAIGREIEWIDEQLALHQAGTDALVTEYGDCRWHKLTERRTASGDLVGFRVDVTELQNALMTAEAANHAKSDFMNTISHELRTPLTIVLGYNRLMTDVENMPACKTLLQKLDSMPDGEDREELKGMVLSLVSVVSHFAEHIETSGDQLLNLVDQLLDLSAIEMDSIVLKPEKVLVSALGEAILARFGKIARTKEIKLTASFDEGSFQGDNARIRQILFNLVDNAVKFTASGYIRVLAGLSEDFVKFQVIDTGCGIDQEYLDQIFEKFTQGDSSGTRNHNGAGLGLAVTKHLVELHGGQISVDSTPDKGSTFTVLIPIRAYDDENPAKRWSLAA